MRGELLPELLLLLPLISSLLFALYKTPDKRATPLVEYIALSIFTAELLLSLFAAALTAKGAIFVLPVGSWLPPYGIVIVMDGLSALMLFTVNLVFFATALYSFFEGEERDQAVLPLIFLLQTGVSLALLTGDFFNLFVAVELLFTASYSLMAISLPKEEGFSKMLDYISLSMAGSFLLLTMAGCFYAFTGHLNMAAASEVLSKGGSSKEVLILGSLALLIFGLQAGLFPLYFWLPDSYPLLPTPLAALFGGVLSKVGFYLLLRFFVTILPHGLEELYTILLIFSLLTMSLGVMGAVSKGSIKEILSYHITSQTGYMTMALALFSNEAIAGAIFFTLHNIVVKSSLYLLGGIASLFYGCDSLKKMGGAWQLLPLGGVLFFIQALSLSGIPPFSGFWGKYLIAVEAIGKGYMPAALLAIATSFFTFFSMLKIWSAAYMGPLPESIRCISGKKGRLVLSTLPLVAATLLLSFFAEPSIKYIEGISSQLFSQKAYRESVAAMGGKGEVP